MATTKISALSALTTPDGAEELLINDGGTSKKITIANAIIAGTGITKSGATISAAPVALTTVQTAANQSAHLALTAQEGDVVVRSDENKTYMHNGGSAGDMNDYTLLATPTDAVTSVVGQTGVVSTAQIKTALENGIDSVHYVDGSIDTAHIADDQVTADKLANSINTDIATGVTGNTTANAALPKAGGAMTGAITTNSTFDGRDVATDGTKLDGIASSANNYTHPNHSGEVTSTADGATVIADNIVDEANLKVSNAPTNGYFLSAQSGDTGGMTWAEVDALPSQTSNSGKYLTTNGSAASWAVLDTDANTTTKGLYEHAYTIAANYSITSGNNAMTAGPITINSSVSVTIPSGSTWVIA